ncbi:glycosyltransferase [Moheibacter lacus]|uniref:Uncharacterized protein n=1 Tax=Moheibacter lacus TaxID=2745851 RepID=A0A838ZMB2_9FLAO|nr:hypothetical protein [Moheibacter lacus]MBA5628920.1 hypothetical protein [Moheibacter lacus]
MKNLLFISWDGPQTSYMEGLFMPIFHEIAKREAIRFHVIQFTWADEKKIQETRKVAERLGIKYTAFPILRKPIASIGSLVTAKTSGRKLKKYIQENQIDILMPRSTFPAMMVNSMIQTKKLPFRGFRGKGFRGKLIFDADGLPIEERVDFAGLKKGSFQYQLFKSAETQMLQNADAVITRSQKAIEVHLKTIGENFRNKFSVVLNGRDASRFKFDPEMGKKIRKELSIKDEFLFVYAGSLGPQYCFPEMLAIFENHQKTNKSKFLILTGNLEFAEQNIPEHLKSDILLKKVKSEEVPAYLNVAQIGFALRKPTFSMQGVAPIKLGEYLLCGLPVIASKGIGDTETILENFKDCYLYDHKKESRDNISEIMEFIKKTNFADQSKSSEKAATYFSLEAAAESYISAISKIQE